MKVYSISRKAIRLFFVSSILFNLIFIQRTYSQKTSVKNSKTIKIVLPKIKLPKLNLPALLNKKQSLSPSISKTTLKQLKNTKIDRLSIHLLDINSQIEKLQNKREELTKNIEKLNKPDSTISALKEEIVIYNKKLEVHNAVPVGNADIDELIRNLVLLDKLPINNNLTIRPYYTDSKLTYQDLLHLIDTNIEYNPILFNSQSLNIQKLPLSIGQKLNSNRPYGWNDGALSYSKGYQFQVSTGVFVSWKNIKAQLRPEYVQTANGNYEINNNWGQVNPKYKKLLPGNSSLRLDYGKVSFGVSTENLWWGPGIYNALLMSNNAQGFFHYSLKTNRPIKNFLGTFQFNMIGATLTQDSLQGFENNGLRRRTFNPNKRYLSSLAIDYQPSFLKNISFGINRSLQTYFDRRPNDFLQKYIPVFSAFFGSTDVARDTFPQDQTVSIYTKWMFPRSHAELYYQFAYNDAKANWRDFWLDMSHSTAYILGFKKLFILQESSYLDFGMEVMKLGQTPSYLHRNAGNFYEHSQISEGYTNQNQIMGAGAGFGNNMQTLQLSYNKGWSKAGFIFHHILQNPMALVSGVNDLGLRKINWHDYAYGIQARHRYKNILFNANLEWVESKNYLWINQRNKSNFYAYINTIILW